MKIYLATDHAGYELKEEIKLFLEIQKDEIKNSLEKDGQVVNGVDIIDFGAYEYNENDDYPSFISVCAGALSGDVYAGIKNNFAIVFGGSGEGEAIVADKYQGVRAGVINSENLDLVKLLREHNNANILSLGARFVSSDFAKKAVLLFLETKFIESDENKSITRHERRIEEIEDIEKTVNTKITKEELDELEILEDLRKRTSDN